jgi:hypothetical protein
MQRRWKPILVAGHEAAENKVGHVQAISQAKFDGPTADSDGSRDLRFAIGASLALGLPALIGVGIYLAVTVILRMS